jgi:type I restriction enzyme R subunit
MNESETRAELIDPLLRDAGWGVVEGAHVRREFPITAGRLEGAGRRGKKLSADYVLVYRNQRIGVIEAKARDIEATVGVAQAKQYAGMLNVRHTYATNGLKHYAVDMVTGTEDYVDRFPTPEELWSMTFEKVNPWHDLYSSIPFPDKSGSWKLRYYQENAVNAALGAIADGNDRVLLTLATGTGKTSIAFHVAWKLFQAKWNVSDWREGKAPSRRPRILFLADRNILANQAYNDFTSFGAFEDDALARVEPGDIRKRGGVPKNSSVFFTIFQTFMSGVDDKGNRKPYFGEYPQDFFDFIIVDECHRGGANDESTWRGILEYFAPAVQLGLTATPKRDDNVDTYRYFGEPVYTYALKDGINDGFLTPFKVRQITSTMDEYTIATDDTVVEGDLEAGTVVTQGDFNVSVVIEQRERARVQKFMSEINQNEKTLVFCANQGHALMIRDIINQVKASTNPDYCHRVTAEDGDLGEQYLRDFQDNEKSIPTILTTSQKLSTGVDARNVRNIVLMRPVKSMIEFKQIIGRGTRLYDGKDYFTIYDFEKAYQHFADPEWDGPPIAPEPCAKCGNAPCTCAKTPPEPCVTCGKSPCECPSEPCDKCGEEPCTCRRRKKTRVVLSDGKARSIQHFTVTSYWHPDGTPMTSQKFLEMLFGELPSFFKEEDDLRELWSKPDTRAALLKGLEEKGFGASQLEEMQRIIDAQHSDLYDVLAYIRFASQPETREERAERAKARILSDYQPKYQTFLMFVLGHYIKVGVRELNTDKLYPLLKLKYQSIEDAKAVLGAPTEIGRAFTDFQKWLYVRG